ncbi:MAG: hypothetical protein ACRD96_29580, partial [Bryobacteraceae bacterium]
MEPALTSRADRAWLTRLRNSTRARYSPAGPLEVSLSDAVALAVWRRRRLARAEEAILAMPLAARDSDALARVRWCQLNIDGQRHRTLRELEKLQSERAGVIQCSTCAPPDPPV